MLYHSIICLGICFFVFLFFYFEFSEVRSLLNKFIKNKFIKSTTPQTNFQKNINPIDEAISRKRKVTELELLLENEKSMMNVYKNHAKDRIEWIMDYKDNKKEGEK